MRENIPKPVTCDLVLALRVALTKEPDVAFAYLFGSVAKGKSHDRSDIDIAVALEPPPKPAGAFERQLELQIRLEKVAGREVDLVVLQTAPSELVHNVLRHGTPLFIRNRAAHSRFYVAHAQAYFDLQTARALLTRRMLQRLKEGRYGGGTGYDS